jgi:REP element-mobilizing transposase RayT
MQKRHPFETIAICVLPDRLHVIWSLPEGDADFSAALEFDQGWIFTRTCRDRKQDQTLASRSATSESEVVGTARKRAPLPTLRCERHTAFRCASRFL